ncbi:VanZ family protein [Paenibacillus tritici]|uniref:VanZ family protein n=1 Tax=Paenibacillus tritici TaxID=1873425 RepID=A0ABX2DIU2_9BACL|nr:VanZ family protein [Paenibacillus tritici]NQX43741.1 VanZ family protein [Paenibacillus tritici]
MYGLQALLAVYIYILFKIILFKFGSIDLSFLWQQLQHGPENIIGSLQRGNLTPLATLSSTYHHVTPHSFVNFAGNIALFIPFGIFLVLLSPNGKGSGSFSGVLLWSFALSAVLEGAQSVFYIGTLDVDDLLLNTFGGLLGYLLIRPLMSIYITSRQGSSVTQK